MAVLCPTCNGGKKVAVPRTDKYGNTHYVPEWCQTCNGTGKKATQDYPRYGKRKKK
jgi:DnaJ-class molecular chaperone